MLGTLTTVFKDQIQKVIKISKAPTRITEENVFQEGDPNVLAVLDEMVEFLILPGSSLEGAENLNDLFAKAESGKSCLLLVEHYSNMDLSIVSYFAQKAGSRGKDICDSIIAIAGMKLNEDNPVVAAFTGAYSKIVICPSRSLQELDPEKNKEVLLRGNAINRAAMKAIIRHKYKGSLVLVFPSGTRFRPWDPSTKKGVRDVDSYIRSFDYLCFVALNGEILHVQKTDMMNDMVSKDIVSVTVGPVIPCEEFREKVLAKISEEDDKKQAVADQIMTELEKLHIEAEEKRQKLLK